MLITVASLTLRFYIRDGWTIEKVKKLLVNSKMEITFREGAFPKLGNSDYYAVYENSGLKVFKQSEIENHEIYDGGNFGDVDWYIKEGI